MLGKDQIVRRMVDNAVENGSVQHMALVLAETDRAQTEAINRLAEAADVPEAKLTPVDKEERHDEILALVQALAPGDGSPAEWYARHRLDHLDGDSDRLTPYVGMDTEEWSNQIGAWAGAYREGGDYGDTADRDLAHHHVRSTFGVSLAWFEDNVVKMTTSDILRESTVGRLTAVEESIRTAADAIEG